MKTPNNYLTFNPYEPLKTDRKLNGIENQLYIIVYRNLKLIQLEIENFIFTQYLQLQIYYYTESEHTLQYFSAIIMSNALYILEILVIFLI
jgi:hypothetical protein